MPNVSGTLALFILVCFSTSSHISIIVIGIVKASFENEILISIRYELDKYKFNFYLVLFLKVDVFTSGPMAGSTASSSKDRPSSRTSFIPELQSMM